METKVEKRKENESISVSIEEMLDSCKSGNISSVKSILQQAKDNFNCNNQDGDDDTQDVDDFSNYFIGSLQDEKTGLSPLMVASKYGFIEICKLLLEEGAPWNALDRQGKCAGDYAVENEHWDIVNLLVDAGTKAELILGASVRLAMKNLGTSACTNTDNCDGHGSFHGTKDENTVVEYEPCTKPDYLQRNVRYNHDKTLLLDDENDAVMMEWERPLMDIHASTITSNGQAHKKVLNIGFGLGIIDNALQKYNPALHVIIEAHPLVHKQMKDEGWDDKSNVRVCFGRWQDELPKLIEEGIEFDGVFYDTYGEHFTDLEDFHALLPKMLKKPHGIYSFFNGLAPDNLFFHGVACQCVMLQLAQMGLQSEFVRK